ncbi:MAG: hypothetical protein V3U14_13325 [candidate division NC10 bacterium]
MSQDHWILHRIQQNQGSVFANVTKARRKLETYCLLQAALFNLDVATEPEYQKKYIWLYGMRRQPINWLNSYFSLLQAKKGNDAVSFIDILPTLSTPQRIEASFSSKLLATIRPEMPVIDAYVISNLGLARPRRTGSRQHVMSEWTGLHSSICSLYGSLLQQDMFRKIRDDFDRSFDQYRSLTDIKKLDVLLWQLR